MRFDREWRGTTKWLGDESMLTQLRFLQLFATFSSDWGKELFWTNPKFVTLSFEKSGVKLPHGAVASRGSSKPRTKSSDCSVIKFEVREAYQWWEGNSAGSEQ